MAKLKKYPKQPKAKASLATWENYRTKCQAVDKHNNGIKTDAAKKASVIKSVLVLKNKRK